jgi:S-layer protein
VGDTGSTSGVNFNLATIKNVENLTYQAANGEDNSLNLAGLSGLQTVSYTDMNSTAKNITINTKGNATSVTVKNAASVTVSDAATTDTLASVSIDGNSGAATITSDALTSLSLANTNQNATVTAAPGTRTLNVTVNNVTGEAAIQDNTAPAVAITGSSKASSIGLTAAAATSLSFAGDAAVTLTAAPDSVTGITSTNTAGVTITTALGTGVSFTGGDGKDKVEVGATTKTIDMGKGDDTVVITTGVTALGSGGTIDGGDGTDTLGLTAADAAAAATALGAKLTSFERIALSSATDQIIDMSKLNNINYVSEAGDGNTLTLNNFANNGTFVFTDASTDTAINVKDAATGTSDVLNLVVKGSSAVAAGTVTVANVETLHLNVTDVDPVTSLEGHALTLKADSATSLTIDGNTDLSLTLDSATVKLATVDAHALTGGLTLDANDINGAVAMTIKGGQGSDWLVASVGTNAKADVLDGGNGNDVLVAGSNSATLIGGAGNDIFVLSAASTTANSYSTIMDFEAGDLLQLGYYDGSTNSESVVASFTKLTTVLQPTASFTDFVNAAMQQLVVNTTYSGGGAVAFQYGEDAYVVVDSDTATTTGSFANGEDLIIKLAGVNVDHLSFNSQFGTVALV